MKKIWILGTALVAAGALYGDTVAIGNLQLNDPYNDGTQYISFYDLTDATQGCQVSGYPVCSGVDISSWALTIYFTPTGGLPTSQTFLSGPSDVIGPYDGSTPYQGGSSGTWQIPLNSGPLPCPPCDNEITQVVFSGTINPADIPFTLADNSTFNADANFSTTWMIPATDYVFGPALFDSADVLVNGQQVSISSVPEPANLRLLCAAMLACIVLLRGWRSLSKRASR